MSNAPNLAVRIRLTSVDRPQVRAPPEAAILEQAAREVRPGSCMVGWMSLDPVLPRMLQGSRSLQSRPRCARCGAVGRERAILRRRTLRVRVIWPCFPSWGRGVGARICGGMKIFSTIVALQPAPPPELSPWGRAFFNQARILCPITTRSAPLVKDTAGLPASGVQHRTESRYICEIRKEAADDNGDPLDHARIVKAAYSKEARNRPRSVVWPRAAFALAFRLRGVSCQSVWLLAPEAEIYWGVNIFGCCPADYSGGSCGTNSVNSWYPALSAPTPVPCSRHVNCLGAPAVPTRRSRR